MQATQEREALRVDYEARLSATEADVAAATIELKQLRDAAATAEAAAMVCLWLGLPILCADVLQAELAAAIAEEEARRAKFAEWQLVSSVLIVHSQKVIHGCGRTAEGLMAKEFQGGVKCMHVPAH